VKSKKSRPRLSLMPALCAEQFLETEPHLDLTSPAPSLSRDGSPPLESDTTAPRLGLQTGLGVVPFVGSALSTPTDSPERIPGDSGITATTRAPFCDLDAGISYSLGSNSNLNLGYRLPSSVWSSVFGPLSDSAAESAGKKISIGVDIGF